MGHTSGAGIYCNEPKLELSFSLGEFATVFQTEVYAILTRAMTLLAKQITGRMITFFSGSQAAIEDMS